MLTIAATEDVERWSNLSNWVTATRRTIGEGSMSRRLMPVHLCRRSQDDICFRQRRLWKWEIRRVLINVFDSKSIFWFATLLDCNLFARFRRRNRRKRMRNRRTHRNRRRHTNTLVTQCNRIHCRMSQCKTLYLSRTITPFMYTADTAFAFCVSWRRSRLWWFWIGIIDRCFWRWPWIRWTSCCFDWTTTFICVGWNRFEANALIGRVFHCSRVSLFPPIESNWPFLWRFEFKDNEMLILAWSY